MKTKLALLLAFLVTHFFTAARAAEVVIPDTALKTAIWQTLGRPLPVRIVTEEDMLSLTSLYACCSGVRSLEGLAAARNLSTLYLSDNQLTSLTLPADLTSLGMLDLSANLLTNLTLPPGLTNLTTLFLRFNGAAEFALDGDVSNLTTLDLRGIVHETGGGLIATLTLPVGLTSLTTLRLYGNQLTNLTLPTDLSSLTTLELGANALTKLTLPTGLASLTTLSLGVNQLTSLTLPDDLTNLTLLDLAFNHLTRFGLPAGLTSLTWIDLRGNQLASVTLPDGLKSLITINLGGNLLQSFVVPEPLALGALAGLVADLRSQGVSVSVYLPTLRLVASPRTLGETFELLLIGPPGMYRIQVTRDFLTWTELDPVTLDSNGSVKITDTSSNLRPHSFYRAVRPD